MTSDLRRCHDLGQDLARALELELTVRSDLREQHFGAWDEQPWSEVGADHAFWRDPVGVAPPGGEAYAGVVQRVARTVAQLPGGVGLIVGHAGSLRAALATWLGLPLDRALDLSWEPFGLTRVDLYRSAGEDGGSPRGLLRYHNLPADDALIPE